MRTTLDLPDGLLKRAKIAAVERGTTLRDLIGSAVTKDLDGVPTPERRRVSFPLFSSKRPGSLALTNVELARAEIDEDLRKSGLPR
jgi:hypothetical protein